MKNIADTQTAELLGAPLAGHLTSNLPTHVEALPDFQPIAPLSDQDLVDGGLAPVQSWMRTERTKNALRVEKCLAKKAAAGVKQLNVQAPVESHETLKAVAKATPEVLARVAEALAVQPSVEKIREGEERIRFEELGRRVMALTGWRRRVVFWILK
jgi:hypothetical protein